MSRLSPHSALLRRTAVGLALSTPLLFGGVAAAAQYPVTHGGLTVTSGGAAASTVQPGGRLTLAGGGFAPGARVTLLLDSAATTLGHVHATAAGSFRATVTVPAATAAGTHTVLAEGAAPDGGSVVLRTQVTVARTGTATATAASALPFSGAEIGAMAGIGGLAVVAGAGALLAARRRDDAV